MIDRRNFLKMLGLSAGALLTGCGGDGGGGGGAGGSEGSFVVPNGYRFVPLMTSGEELSPRSTVYALTSGDRLPFLGPVAINDLRHVAFHATDEEGRNGVYRVDYETVGATSPVRTLLKEGDLLSDGTMIDEISPGCINNADACAFVVRDTEGRQTLQYSGGDGDAFRKLLTPYEDVTGQVRLYGDLHPELSISDGSDLMLCSHYRDAEGLCKGQGLFYVPHGEKSEARLVLSRDELLPGTSACISTLGLFALRDGGDYLVQGSAYPLEGEVTDGGPLTYLLQGRVGEAPETLFAHPALGAENAIPGTITMAPRLGNPGISVVVQSSLNNTALYFQRTRLLEADFEAGGTLSPRGSRIISMFPPVFGPGGQIFLQVFTEAGMELLVFNGQGFSTVLATGDAIGARSVSELLFGVLPESVNSYGELVCVAYFTDGTSSIVLGIPV